MTPKSFTVAFPPPVQSAFLRLNLLEDKVVRLRIVFPQARPCPLLIFLCIVLLQTLYVLGHLLQHLGFELTLRLTRAQLPIGSILCALESGSWRGGDGLKFPLLGRCGGGVDIAVRICGFTEDPLLRKHCRGHVGGRLQHRTIEGSLGGRRWE